jgi:hypothetical protein
VVVVLDLDLEESEQGRASAHLIVVGVVTPVKLNQQSAMS